MSSPNPYAGNIHDLVSSYALNALDEWEKKMFEEHLHQGCAACEADLRDFIHVTHAIGQSATAYPSAELRERVRSQTAISPQVPGVVLQQNGVLISRADELSWQTLAQELGISLCTTTRLENTTLSLFKWSRAFVTPATVIRRLKNFSCSQAIFGWKDGRCARAIIAAPNGARLTARLTRPVDVYSYCWRREKMRSFLKRPFDGALESIG